MSSASFILNPYNVLGLYSDSTQSEVRKRVGLIGKMLAIDESVEFDSDVFIGPSDRTLDAVKSCETRLNNPQDRLADVFFWFADSPEALAAANMQDRDYFRRLGSNTGYMATRDYTEEKNAAVGFSIIFEKTQNKTDFDQALQRWASFIHLDSFWDYWAKYYKSIDYLDTSDRLIDEFRENIDSLITERFFEVSKLDDLIDAQIVGKYFKVSTEAAEKAAEQQLGRIKELRIEADRLRNSNTLLNGQYVLSEASKGQISALLSKAIALHEELVENGQRDSPAVERELDSLWSDILAITVTAHNMSGQHDAVNLRDLEFLKQVIEKLYRESTDDLLDSRLKKNLSAIKEQMETLEEQERVEPQFSRLTALVEKLANGNSPNNSPNNGYVNPRLTALLQKHGIINSPNKEFVEARLSEFESIYIEIVNSGKLKYETLADAVSMTAGIFNKLAVTISNNAQKSVNRAAQSFKFNTQITPQNERFSLLVELDGAINSAISDLEFSKKVLGRLKNMQIDSTLKSTINQNYSGVSSTISSLNQMLIKIGLTRSSSGGGGCYVATAVYGSYDCPSVWILRRFRDNDLANSIFGRVFIHAYYAISPSLVRMFGNTSWFKTLCRKPLDLLVAKCRAKGYSDLPYKDQIWS